MTSLTGQIDAMAIAYPVHEAKARLSEIIRHVRSGKSVTVSYRGEPVGGIRSIARPRRPTLDERPPDLERRGSLVRSARAVGRRTFGPVEGSPGALPRRARGVSVAGVDTSVLTTISFDERGADALAARLDEFSRLMPSNLLESVAAAIGFRILEETGDPGRLAWRRSSPRHAGGRRLRNACAIGALADAAFSPSGRPARPGNRQASAPMARSAATTAPPGSGPTAAASGLTAPRLASRSRWSGTATMENLVAYKAQVRTRGLSRAWERGIAARDGPKAVLKSSAGKRPALPGGRRSRGGHPRSQPELCAQSGWRKALPRGGGGPSQGLSGPTFRT